MRALGWTSLAILLLAGGPSAAAEITVYRCQDAKGGVTLQDEPCPAGQSESTRSMTRPKDPPPKPVAAPAPTRTPMPELSPQALQDYSAPYPPPPLFQCTDYDGDVRYSEEYNPGNRCVPLAVLGYSSSPQYANACRWVQESCLQMDDASACDQFVAKLKKARSDALHAFSDTAAYRKSEVARLERIVNESCR